MSWSIERYLNIRQAYGATWRANGKHVAFLTDITGLSQVWQVAVDDVNANAIPWPDQLSFASDRVTEVAYSPAPGDGRLLYVSDVGGSEQHQLFLLDVDRGSVRCLTEGFEDAMHLFGSWSDDGKRISFAANRRDPALFDLYVQDVSEPESRAVCVWQNDTRGYLWHLVFAPDGRHVIAVRTASSFDHTLLEIDLETGEARTLLGSDAPVRYLYPHYAPRTATAPGTASAPRTASAPNGDTLYLVTDLDADFLYVARVDLAAEYSRAAAEYSRVAAEGGRPSGKLERIAAPNWDCGSLAITRDGTKLAYTVNVDGADRVVLMDTESGEIRECPSGPEAMGVVIGDALAFSPDGTALAFSFSSATRTADLYLWDLVADEVHPLTRSSHGGLPVSTFYDPVLVHYPTFDRDEDGETRRIPAWFYRPQAAERSVLTAVDARLPVVVIVHGGPEGQSRPGFSFLIQYLLHHGYAVLVPNVRGSTGYGKRYSHLDDVEKRMDSVADLAHAVYWLRSRPEIDGSRIAVYGGSYGGFMVLSAVTTYPDLWAAAVDIVGISNLATFLENTSGYRRAHREAEYGSLARDRDFLERIAPINHIDQVVAPLMVIHGRNDPRVPLSEAEQLVAALEARDIPVRFLVFDDEGHGVAKLKNKLVAYPAIVDFLRETLGQDA